MATTHFTDARILQILKVVFSQLQLQEDVSALDTAALLDSGFTKSEISRALSWWWDNRSTTTTLRSPYQQSAQPRFRSFHPAEQRLFSVEARGELIQLQSLGMLDVVHIEHVIERCVRSEQQNISLETLYALLAEIFFRRDNNAEMHAMLSSISATIH